MRRWAAVTGVVGAVALLASGCAGTPTTLTPPSTAPALSTTPSSSTTTTLAVATPVVDTTAPFELPSTPTATVVDDVLRGSSDDGRYSYEVTWPKLQRMNDPSQQDAVNADILTGVTAAADEFITQAKAAPPLPADQANSVSRLTGDYQIFDLTKRLVSLKLTMSQYIAGAAHPSTVLQSYTFELPTGARLALADLFTPGAPYLQALSEQSREQLNARPGAEGSFIDPGTEPTDENFAVWNINEEKDLVITFRQYQVAPGSGGEPVVALPFRSLPNLIDPDGPR